MHQRHLLLFFVLAALFAVPCFAQATLVSLFHNVHKIQSQVLGEERTILVRVPASYTYGTAKYPVAYMLDAHPPQNAMMAGILDQQNWGGQMPEMILVGIQNVDRTRDMTPTRTERANSGGAGKFLDFIEKEVIPLVDKTYRTEQFRLFAGHSLGGLAVVNCLITRPELFNAYIAASPVLHWDKNYVINQAKASFEQKRPLKKTLFVGLGNEPDYLGGFNAFRELLEKNAPKDLEFEFAQFKEDTHGSVVLPAYYAGLRKIFQGWLPPPVSTIAQLEAHYDKLSKRMNYTVLVPEFLANQFGYEKLRDGKITEAVEVFKRNTELYPDSANTYDSLGEALERNGQIKDAARSYERAYKLALAAGDNQLAQSAKANYERLAAKSN